MELKQGFKIGPWEVRPLTGEVSGAAGVVHVEPKVMEVLLALAQQPGEVVEREELLRRIWGSRAAVSDEPLTRCIAELRRALGDSRQAPTYIQTIPKRGYRLLSPVVPLPRSAAPAAPVLPASASTPDNAAPGTPPRAWRANRPTTIGAVALLVALIALVGGWALQTLNGGAPTATTDEPIARNTIAVLPFVSDAPDGAYLGEGLADEILNRLSAVDGLRVVARTSAFAVRGSADDVRGIGARLRVAHVLEGTVRRSGDQVRIDARLIDAERGYQLWAASYDGVLDDIFSLEDEIANTIVDEAA